MCRNGEVPEEAKKLARTYSLEIQVSEDSTEIEIVAAPRLKSVEYSDLYTPGRVWSLDIVDEFVDLSKDCALFVDDVAHSPKIKEAHALKFRPRMNTKGDKRVQVVVNGDTVFDEVIRQKT
jgi:hypothetical protein